MYFTQETLDLPTKAWFLCYLKREIPLIQGYSQVYLNIFSLEQSQVVCVSTGAQMERDPGSRERREDHRITVSAAACSPAPGKGFPRRCPSSAPAGEGFPIKAVQAQLALPCSREVLQLCSGCWGGGREVRDLVGVTALLRSPRVLQFCWTRGKFPGKSGTVLLWSSPLRLQGSCDSDNVTLCNKPHSRFIGKENPGGGGVVAASSEKLQQTKQGPEFI